METYGCQMNEYDSELIRSILTKANYAFVKDETDADVIMLNTCAIRENAHRKIYGRIHDIHNARRKRFNLPKKHTPSERPNGYKEPLIGILGCMATNLRKELFENRNLKVDFIAGPDSYKKLPDLIQEAGAMGEKPFDLTLSEFETYSDVYPVREKGVNAWLAVMRGCNNFCTFCVVPYTRGRERSRSIENVVEETRHLADEGFRQVTLLGQNVNSYSHEGKDFADLIGAVSKVNGIERIRFTSPHPKDFPDRLLQVIATNKKACKHIHLPLQAGSNRILGLMDRIYTKEEYLKLVEKIRKTITGVALTTDIIVGFPSETDAEFEETFSIMRDVEYDSSFIFKYSQRQGTIAEKKFPDDVSDEKKAERVNRLGDLQRAICLKKNTACLGKTFEVLIDEETTPLSPNDFKGRTDGNQVVIFKSGPYKQGDFVNVKITQATSTVLKGEVIPT